MNVNHSFPCEILSAGGLERLLQLTPEELHHANQRASGGLTACRLQLGRGLLAVEELGLDYEWGFSSSIHYAVVRLGVDRREACEARRVANKLLALPRLTAAAEAGTIGWGHLREIVRKASLETEGFWLEQALKLTCPQLERLIARTPVGGYPGDDPDLVTQAEYSEIRMKLNPEQAVILQRAVRAASLKLGRPVCPLFVLTRLCARYLAEEDDISVDQVLKEAAEQVAAEVQAKDREVSRARQEVPEPEPEPKPLFEDGPGRVVARTPTEALVCEEQAPPWAVASAREQACPTDESLEMVVASRVPYWRGTDLEQRLTFNTDTRQCTPAQRRMLLRRDGYHCSTPGCSNHLWLHVHHVVFYYLGGPTVPLNLCVVCSKCHKNIHEGRLVVKGSAPDELNFTDRWGKPLVRPVDLAPPPELVAWIHSGRSESLSAERAGDSRPGP